MQGGTEIPSKLVLLGTGTPNADSTRSGPSVAVIVEERPYLIDFGAGVVRQIAAARAAGITGLEVSKLTRAFLTHLHSDHTTGYPDLILTPWTMGRTEPLSVYGPTGLQAMTDLILSAYAEDIRERLEGLEPANTTGHRVDVQEIEPGLVYEDDHIRVEAFAVNHGTWPAYGFRLTTPDRVLVISGDTAPFPGWEKAYADCDLLLHEVRSEAGLDSRPAAWQAYHRAVHTSSVELAEVASIVRPKLLVLYHQLFHGIEEEELLREIRDRYDGEVVSGQDLDTF